MARYTMSLADVLDTTGGTFEVVNGRTIITGGNIGLEHYPIFDEDYRDELNGLIFDHYRVEEIGTESVSMFQLRMRSRMNEIMPFYNKLYEAELIEFDPLSTINMRTEATGQAVGNTESVSERNATVTSGSESGAGARNVNSETPQVMLSGNKDYASSAADSTSTSFTEGESEESGESVDSATQNTENETESITSGYQGHAAELLARYRNSIISVDAMVIEALRDLFMLTWGTNDSYTEHGAYSFGWYATQQF